MAVKTDTEIILRALEPTDIDALYKWENDPEIWHVSNTCTPYSKYILEKYIENSHLDIYQVKQLRLMIDIREKRARPYDRLEQLICLNLIPTITGQV